MNDKYILEGKEPKPVDDLIAWGKWFQTNSRVVQKTKIGELEVSTVFLGLNHNWSEGQPILFETMVFGGENDDFQERYSTWDQAVAGHELVCKKVLNGERL